MWRSLSRLFTTASEYSFKVKHVPRGATLKDLKQILPLAFEIKREERGVSVFTFQTKEDAEQAKANLKDRSFMGNTLRLYHESSEAPTKEIAANTGVTEDSQSTSQVQAEVNRMQSRQRYNPRNAESNRSSSPRTETYRSATSESQEPEQPKLWENYRKKRRYTPRIEDEPVPRDEEEHELPTEGREESSVLRQDSEAESNSEDKLYLDYGFKTQEPYTPPFKRTHLRSHETFRYRADFSK
mmetsp:Transcript_1730/g.3686  ORF Transcript_1730/g.3686 Transcript_1730/m.3686 type:complete len:241 (+) Transcript_1730:2-724(+)|eukprot:CAMPEP_0204919250 /NCGR_PEP_ID=MMETSP1397-20131031/16720_1 /ASSEMBLY_ACC=CAM_ASM_000891 /TAXON_ID=49980 /ORGANISM="Climacostomum Climacostomum virens, Strain Stock W-24" /LENGTH=240 /DNA_ID=CAMNT_0052092833 /DNA_START=9 /DNA_END=731 /DNA_ORIENTATION=+